MTVGDLLGNGAETPLLVVIASGLLAIAGFVGKRAAASMQRQGARLGRAEITLKSEQTRRRQLEECLRGYGFPLPYWPDDPAELYRPPPARPGYLEDDVDDQAPATEVRRVPVPPFPEAESARLSRHRR